MEWISTKIRFPEAGEEVLTACKNKNMEDGIWLYDLCYYYPDSGWENRDNWEDVLYWAYIDEPIPLTPEILEKNGFIKENESWWYKDFRIVLDNSNGESLICGRQIKFTHVHQLQHALRLCGIEKEIEL